jgi:two-component system, OmpR family, sensor kinase
MAPSDANAPRKAERPFWPPSLRDKLCLLAVQLVLLTLAASLILGHTAREAEKALSSTRTTLAVTAAYSGLSVALSEIEAWSLRAELYDAPPAQMRAQIDARIAEAMGPLEAAVTAAGPDRRAGLERVKKLLPSVLTLYASSPEVLTRLAAFNTSDGGQRFLTEIERLYEPTVILEDAIAAEIAAGHRETATASASAEEMIRTQTNFGVAAAVFAFLSALAFAIILWRRLDPGLARIEEALTALSAGDFGHRMNMTGDDELAELSRAFDRMSDEIASQRAALEDANSGLEKAVAERTMELEAANAALAEEDARRRRFFAEAGHELRTPLTVIRGEAQVALRELDAGRGDPGTGFERILAQTELMTRLTDDLFLIARAEAGGLGLRREHIDLGEVARQVAEDFGPLAGERGVRLAASAVSPVAVRADRDRIRQIVAALIDNALRHAEGATRIEVAAAVEGGAGLIWVADDGAGVPESERPALFDRFRRGPTRGEGSGLGLSVVRALAEAHGGSASLEAGAGGGVRAVIRLPLASMSARLEPAA